ncbi:hypothetical protein FEZ60_19230 [Rhodococcus sp. MS16]|uniref:hypothetical protein n=1 Tax=Rhodococcus sp. MS16 TaxID=2579941 RepID=UPI0015621B26|nr:hypothetical protein [Rhodococcus sp. MS16]NRI67659.1 hypothetical protein [Rhodococcus sp. MS16]
MSPIDIAGPSLTSSDPYLHQVCRSLRMLNIHHLLGIYCSKTYLRIGGGLAIRRSLRSYADLDTSRFTTSPTALCEHQGHGDDVPRFQWIVEEYPWAENSLFVTYVQNADPQSVIDALTIEGLGTATGLTGVNERGWDEFSIIGATPIGTWTVAIAPGTFVGDEELAADGRTTSALAFEEHQRRL